ncbi:MAG: cyclic-di-AMP receptor [Chloroflexota bacterium]|nr:cyclic-di-AMP receptor [Chloroflexota bacterium]
MKLILSIVNTDDARGLIEGLLKDGYRATIISTTGGFLREGNSTVISGVEDDQVASVLDIIRENCHTRTRYVNPLPPATEPSELYIPTPMEVEVGGATVFVFEIEQFEKF